MQSFLEEVLYASYFFVTLYLHHPLLGSLPIFNIIFAPSPSLAPFLCVTLYLHHPWPPAYGWLEQTLPGDGRVAQPLLQLPGPQHEPGHTGRQRS